MLALREAAIAGVGVVQLPLLMVRDQLAAGELVVVLDEWQPRREVIHAVFASRRGLLPRSGRWWIFSAKSISGWKRISICHNPGGGAMRLSGLGLPAICGPVARLSAAQAGKKPQQYHLTAYSPGCGVNALPGLRAIGNLRYCSPGTRIAPPREKSME
jgi:hypothetical protein